MPLPLLAIGAAAAPSIVKGISGLFQSAKGKKLARNNPRPAYEIPKEFEQNLAIAENMGQVGLPQQQYNQAVQNFSRNQANALRAFGRSGNPRGLAGIVRAGNDATLGLDVADANARLNNQRNTLGYRTMLGQQKLAQQDWNKLQKYQENAQIAANLQNSGAQNTFGGLNDLSQLGQLALMGQQMGGQNTSNDPTFGGNFTKNPLLNRLLGINRQQYIGQMPGYAGVTPTTGGFKYPISLPTFNYPTYQEQLLDGYNPPY